MKFQLLLSIDLREELNLTAAWRTTIGLSSSVFLLLSMLLSTSSHICLVHPGTKVSIKLKQCSSMSFINNNITAFVTKPSICNVFIFGSKITSFPLEWVISTLVVPDVELSCTETVSGIVLVYLTYLDAVWLIFISSQARGILSLFE